MNSRENWVKLASSLYWITSQKRINVTQFVGRNFKENFREHENLSWYIHFRLKLNLDTQVFLDPLIQKQAQNYVLLEIHLNDGIRAHIKCCRDFREWEYTPFLSLKCFTRHRTIKSYMSHPRQDYSAVQWGCWFVIICVNLCLNIYYSRPLVRFLYKTHLTQH